MFIVEKWYTISAFCPLSSRILLDKPKDPIAFLIAQIKKVRYFPINRLYNYWV